MGSTPAAKEGAGSGACMWGFVGAASFAAVRGLMSLVLGSDEDVRFMLDMQRRMEIKSAEDAFSNQTDVARRCWSACIDPVDGPSQPGTIMPEGLSPDEMSCLNNCATKVSAFQLRAAEVMYEDLQNKKQENMKAMEQQQFAQRRMM